MLFDLEERKRRWERVPMAIYTAGFLAVLVASLLLSWAVLRGSENLYQGAAGAALALASSLYSVFFFRSEFSREDLVKTFLNGLLLSLGIFLVSGFLVMFAVLLGPHIAKGFRIKAMKILIAGFQQVITTYLLLSPGILALLSLLRMGIKK